MLCLFLNFVLYVYMRSNLHGKNNFTEVPKTLDTDLKIILLNH